jgi:hypothetical protein
MPQRRAFSFLRFLARCGDVVTTRGSFVDPYAEVLLVDENSCSGLLVGCCDGKSSLFACLEEGVEDAQGPRGLRPRHPHA